MEMSEHRGLDWNGQTRQVPENSRAGWSTYLPHGQGMWRVSSRHREQSLHASVLDDNRLSSHKQHEHTDILFVAP